MNSTFSSNFICTPCRPAHSLKISYQLSKKVVAAIGSNTLIRLELSRGKRSPSKQALAFSAASSTSVSRTTTASLFLPAFRNPVLFSASLRDSLDQKSLSFPKTFCYIFWFVPIVLVHVASSETVLHHVVFLFPWALNRTRLPYFSLIPSEPPSSYKFCKFQLCWNIFRRIPQVKKNLLHLSLKN